VLESKIGPDREERDRRREMLIGLIERYCP
jgi:hypothetical protein